MSDAVTFEVRIRKFGRIISRHVEASNSEQAGRKVKGKKKKGVVILGIRKVDSEDIIGRADNFRLIKEVIGKMPMQVASKKFGIVNEDTTLDGIVFRKKYDLIGNETKQRQRHVIDTKIVKDSFKKTKKGDID